MARLYYSEDDIDGFRQQDKARREKKWTIIESVHHSEIPWDFDAHQQEQLPVYPFQLFGGPTDDELPALRPNVYVPHVHSAAACIIQRSLRGYLTRRTVAATLVDKARREKKWTIIESVHHSCLSV